MYKFLPYMTNDFSTGLYSEDTNDIYHSAFGALSEAYEKFVNVVANKLTKGEVNVLDICYGIGYNTKVLLNETLHKKICLNIDCVDNDEVLAEISPFIKSNIGLFDKIFRKEFLFKNIKKYESANRICSKQNFLKKQKYKIDDDVNLILMKNMSDDIKFHDLSNESKKICSNHENTPFINQTLVKFYEFLVKKEIYLHLNNILNAFVHNIYYRNITKRYKTLEDSGTLNRYKVNFHISDIREYLKICSKTYDIVFLDGFTPKKCPFIWSIELFERLKELMYSDGVIVTYNTSAPVRNAMRQSGFFIGNTLDENNNVIGTIASLSENNIDHKLTDEQKGLLDTKAGIVYRDKDLSSSYDDIIKYREREIEQSSLITSSAYYKTIGQ